MHAQRECTYLHVISHYLSDAYCWSVFQCWLYLPYSLPQQSLWIGKKWNIRGHVSMCCTTIGWGDSPHVWTLDNHWWVLMLMKVTKVFMLLNFCEPEKKRHVHLDAQHISIRSFFFTAPQLWNKLPQVLRSSDSICSFKKSLKSHMFPF